VTEDMRKKRSSESEKTRRRSVSFSSWVDIQWVYCAKDPSCLWYQRHEFREIACEVRSTIIHFLERERSSQAIGGEGLCLRGLENHTLSRRDLPAIKERKMKTALIVLLEQDRQLDEDGRVIDNEKLAYCLKGVSRKNADRARRRAISDEMAAMLIFERSGDVVKPYFDVHRERSTHVHGRVSISPLTIDSSAKRHAVSSMGRL